MVDTSAKAVTARRAVASARVLMSPETVAALTVYDMCKALDKAMTVTDVRLERKTGGKSGDYERAKQGERGKGGKGEKG